jgi:hypothetical protein
MRATRMRAVIAIAILIILGTGSGWAQALRVVGFNLVAHFRLNPAGPEFLFMVNHLYRSNAERRHEQARLLNAWAREQTIPGIAVEDYNFHWDVMNGETVHDQGYALLTAEGIFAWIRPAHLIRTQCSFNSVSDFAFVAGAAQRWRASSEILAPEESYCPSDQNRSDHRPVLAQFQLSGNGQPSARQLLLVHIQRLDEELSALKALLEQMPE